jgi:hypothetical protein
MGTNPEHLRGRGLVQRVSRLLLAAAVGAGTGALLVGCFGALCGLIFAGIHGKPDRVMVLGEWGALAGAAAGALALAFDSLFDGELFEDLVRLLGRRRAEKGGETNRPLPLNRVASRLPLRRPGVLSPRKPWPEREPGSQWDGPFSSN